MRLVKKEYVKYLEWGFKLAYLFLGIASFNVFLYDSQIQPALVKVCLVLGAVTLAARLFYWKSYIKTPYWWLLALFCVSFLVTILANRQYGAVSADLKWLIWTGMLFFLLYVCDMDRDRQAYRKEFVVFSHVLILCSLLSSAASLYLMTQLYHQRWYTASGELMLAGFQWGRLWGVYTDPNYGSVFSVVGVLLSVYYLKKYKRTWKMIPYILVVLLDYLYIIFSDSRTAEVAMCVGVGILLAYWLVGRLQNWKGILFAVLTVILFAGCFVGMTSSIKNQYNVQIEAEIKKADAEKAAKNNTQKPNSQTSPSTQETVGRKQDIQSDISNGRFSLWESGLEIWATKSVIGTGYNSFLPYVKENLPDTYVVNNNQKEYVSLHNGYINILVYQGILGAAVFLAFMAAMVYTWCRGLKNVRKEDRDYIAILMACVAAIAVSMVFLLEGVYTNSPGTFILWNFLGYLMHYFMKYKNTRVDNR